MSVPTKQARMNPFIGTHDKTFHCDDVTACYMLKQLDRFKDHDIVRTRDQETLDRAEIVVDVGSVLDVDKLRLDHHQRSFNQTIKDYHPDMRTTNPDKAVRLSSSGLVYAIFGKDLIIKLLNLGAKYEDLSEEKRSMVDAIYKKAYLEFFEEIDAGDNGVEMVTGKDLVHNYYINSSIAHRVARLNPINKDASDEERLDRFKLAMKLVGAEISEGIEFLGKYWWPQREKLRQMFMKRKEFDPSGQIVFMDGELTGWKSAFVELEEQMGIVGEIKYIIYTDGTIESPWRAIAMPVSEKSFVCRMPLKEEWRGKRGEDLQNVSGVADASFVHMSGFTGGAKSLDGVKKLVRLTLGLE